MDDTFVLGCLTHRLFPDQPLPAVLDDADWPGVYASLVRHGLAGAFYRLGLEHRGLWPEALQDALRRSYHSALLWGDHCGAEVRTVLDGLAQAGIPALVLKGWAAIPTIYGGDFGQRTYADVDLLVHPRDAAQAEMALQGLNYRAGPEPWPGFERRFYNSRTFQLARQPGAFGQVFAVSLHWHLLDTPYFFGRMPAGPFFARSRRVQLVGREVSVLCPEDHVVYACGHLALHHEYGDALLRYFELACLLLQEGSELDWRAVLERTAAWRLVLPVQRVLAHLSRLWPQTVPPSVLDRVAALRATAVERAIHDWVVAYRGNHSVRTMLAWVTQPGWGRKLRYPLETAFPGPAFMSWRYGPAPGGFWPLLYLRRATLGIGYLVHRKGTSSRLP